MSNEIIAKTPEKTEFEEDFARLINGNMLTREHFQPGDKVRATIVNISGEYIFIDVGAKSEGIVALSEFMDNENNVTVRNGDIIEVFFLSQNRGELLFTSKIGKGSAAKSHLTAAFDSKIPVEGYIAQELKGGMEVKIAEGIRGFCPFSQLGLPKNVEPKSLIGVHEKFRIIELREHGRSLDIVLSRKAIIEEDRAIAIEEFRNNFKKETVFTGEITSVQKFGAFVKVGPVEGLIPISHLSWGRLEQTTDAVTVGQHVQVKAMELNWDKGQFTFSMREAMADPWEDFLKSHPVGSIIKGKVIRLANFGAFVELIPGVDGLLHISQLGKGKRISHAREAIKENDIVDVKIESADTAARRISLSWVTSSDDAAQQEDTDKNLTEEYFQNASEKPTSFGTFGDMLKKHLKK